MFSQRETSFSFPSTYTDIKSYKKRPVIIVSGNEYNNIFEDVIVVAVTSNMKPVRFSIPLDNSSLEEGSLKVPSVVRPDKIYTLHKNIIVENFGKVSVEILEKIKKSIAGVMEW